jgi:hypothetical protein
MRGREQAAGRGVGGGGPRGRQGQEGQGGGGEVAHEAFGHEAKVHRHVAQEAVREAQEARSGSCRRSGAQPETAGGDERRVCSNPKKQKV